jgi:hypothetical protein
MRARQALPNGFQFSGPGGFAAFFGPIMESPAGNEGDGFFPPLRRAEAYAKKSSKVVRG